MRNESVVALVVVAILAGAVAGYVVGANVSESETSKSTSTTSTSTQTTCIIPAEGEVLLQVLNSTSGKPILSVPVQGQLTPIPCGSNSQTTIPLNTTLTNGTGYAEFGPELGEYHLTLHALGNYFVDASTLPERTTCVTLGIPSGETVIEYSATFQFGC